MFSNQHQNIPGPIVWMDRDDLLLMVKICKGFGDSYGTLLCTEAEVQDVRRRLEELLRVSDV